MHSIIKNLIPASVIRQRLKKKDGNRCILLTFDDGPHNEFTLDVLNILDSYKAKALFFIIGSKVNSAEHLLKEIISRGHKIGNHSFYHDDLVNFSYKQLKNELLMTQEKIYTLTGEKPIYFRPPTGRITIPNLAAAKSVKLKIIRWSFDTGEYSYMRHSQPEEIAENFLQNLKNRDIILSHDNSKKIPEVLRIVLPILNRKGYDLQNGLDFIE